MNQLFGLQFFIKRKILKIAIIGAGAAGIMAAITAKRLNKNLQIDLFDANKSIGKKY